MTSKGSTGSGAPSSAVPSGIDIASLVPFVGRAAGIVLRAPKSWQDTSDESVFQVVDPQSGVQFSASAYENTGLASDEWARYRLESVKQGFPRLRASKDQYLFQGTGWVAHAAEYEGHFGDEAEVSHYLVLCIVHEDTLISFTVSGEKKKFEDTAPIIFWLLQNQLEIYGVQRIGTDQDGLSLLQKAAEENNVDAQFNLAVLYELGEGVEKSLDQAVVWYRKAAEKGHAKAQYNLGVYYANGTVVGQNYEIAALMWRDAADQGLADAQFSLAMLYVHGLGVPQSDDMAHHLTHLAALQGHEAAQQAARG